MYQIIYIDKHGKTWLDKAVDILPDPFARMVERHDRMSKTCFSVTWPTTRGTFVVKTN